MTSLRIVNYAVNGAGLGHVARLVAINRWIRRYALLLGVRPEIYFLTSSEADSILFQESFASFKLPSKTVVGESGIDRLTYVALAKQWVWHSLGLVRPDLLIVDTFPRGSFGELLSALDLARQRAFIYRPVKEEVARRPEFQAMLGLYDALLVPEGSEVEVLVPDLCRERLHYFGPVASREKCELLPREQARQALNIAPQHLAVYLSAGGGGDAGAVEHLESLVEALAQVETVHLVVAAGPLYRGRPLYRDRLSWVQGWGSAELLGAVDLAVTAAGYNSCAELWQAGVPALFFPQEKQADEQHRRAQRAVLAGAGEILTSSQPECIRQALAAWSDPQRLQQARRAALQLAPHNYAREMAAELLRLVLPAHRVDMAQEVLSEALLVRTKGLQGHQDLCEMVQHFQPRGRELSSPQTLKLTLLCQELLEQSEVVAVPRAVLSRLALIWSRKLERWSPLERARALLQLLPGLAVWDNWKAVTTMLRLLENERQLKPAELTLLLLQALERWRLRGQDLYALVAYLSESQGQQRESGTNQALRLFTGP